MADALSRIEALSDTLDYTTLAISQQEDDEMKIFLRSNTGLQLKQVQFPGTDVSAICDTTTSTVRPFITKPFLRTTFNMVHRLSHPGCKAMTKLVKQQFVWPSINRDCKH